jgi:hypothetical protein
MNGNKHDWNYELNQSFKFQCSNGSRVSNTSQVTVYDVVDDVMLILIIDEVDRKYWKWLPGGWELELLSNEQAAEHVQVDHHTVFIKVSVTEFFLFIYLLSVIVHEAQHITRASTNKKHTILCISYKRRLTNGKYLSLIKGGSNIFKRELNPQTPRQIDRCLWSRLVLILLCPNRGCW